MSLKTFFLNHNAASRAKYAQRTVIDPEAARMRRRAALENAHKVIVLAHAGLILKGESPAADDTERWERAHRAVAVLQRAV